MAITYGSLRSWRCADVMSASEKLRADVRALERARDAVETHAVPSGWQGLGYFFAGVRQRSLVRAMGTHIQGLTAFERTVFTQCSPVQRIEREVEDIDTDAAAHQFSIDSTGMVSDTSPPQTFDNLFERNEYQQIRVQLRDALVQRMEAVLDTAYAVDSALMADRPQGSFSDEGPESVVDPEVAREWADMSDDERTAVIEHIARQRAKDAGVDDFEVRIEDLEDRDGDGFDDDPDTDLRGSWSEGERVLRIDQGNLDDPTILGTVGHEVRHAQQHKAVDDLPWWWWEDYHGPPGVSQTEVEGWKDNFDHPKNSQDDGFDAYANQSTESDARDTGDDFLDDLDKDDLERIREETR